MGTICYHWQKCKNLEVSWGSFWRIFCWIFCFLTNWRIFWRFLVFRKIFFTYYLWTIASFRIGVSSILFEIVFKGDELSSNTFFDEFFWRIFFYEFCLRIFFLRSFWHFFWWIFWRIVLTIFCDFFLWFFLTYNLLTIASFRIGVPSI